MKLRLLVPSFVFVTVSAGCGPATSSGMSEYDPLDVLIIGAGWAGLAAANRLFRENDVTPTNNFCVFEAQEVIGGRSRTKMGALAPDVPTELGSAWIYEGTNVGNIFRDAGLVTNATTYFDFETRGLYYEPFGGYLDNDGSQAQAMREAYEEFVEFVKYWATPYTAIQELIDGYFADHPELGNVKREAIFSILSGQLDSEYGAYMTDANAEYLDGNLITSYSIDFVAVPGGGYQAALDYFTAPFLEHIQLNTQIDEIDYSKTNINEVVKVTSTDRTTNTTNIHYARAVICTVSTGVLQHGDIRFIPSLPDKKTQAINDLPLGNINKCILYWDEDEKDVAWWPYGITDMQLITEEEEISRDWTYFLNDQNHYANENNHILTAWIGGEAADRWEERNDEEVKDRVIANIRRMFPHHEIPEPSNFIVTHWKSDPFTRGAYSYNSVGVDFDEARFALAKPVDSKLFFAGEATWDSTAVGAYSSGERAVDEIRNSGVLNVSLASQYQPDAICIRSAQACRVDGDCCLGLTCQQKSIWDDLKYCISSSFSLPQKKPIQNFDIRDPIQNFDIPDGLGISLRGSTP